MSKQERKKRKLKVKRSKPAVRISLPPNRRHRSKKDYKRSGKIKPHEVEKD